jgi:hypothetical protein
VISNTGLPTHLIAKAQPMVSWAEMEMVGVPGFEPGASCSQSRRAAGLRYAFDSKKPSRKSAGLWC